jgi:hypothetical protein
MSAWCPSKQKWAWWGLCASVLIPDQAWAQRRVSVEQPRWMKLRITESSVGMESEGTFEDRTSAKSGDSSYSDSVYVVPTVGVGLRGSFVHPNLADFKFTTEDGVGWQENTSTVAGGGSRNEPMYLIRYQGDLDILKEKAYASSLFANRNHSTRTYDFFSRATVDNEQFGGRAGYSSGPVPMSVVVSQSSEDTTGLQRPTSLDDTRLAYTASNRRGDQGSTDLSYNFNDYLRRDIGFSTQRGTDHSISLYDLESLAAEDRVKLTSSLFYNNLDATFTTEDAKTTTKTPSTSFSDQESLNWKHTEDLESNYLYGYSWRESGANTSSDHNGSAGLTHQLYESLRSSFDVHAQSYSSAGGESSLDSQRYGIGLGENYTKKLGDWGKLNLGYTGLLDQEQRESLGGILMIVGEQHTLQDGVPTYLKQPLVQPGTIRVTDATGTIQYAELLDYQIIPRGDLTEIRRVVGGMIQNGSRVLVDYSAAGQPSSSYTTMGNMLSFRLGLFGEWVGLYGRLNLVNHHGGEDLILQDIHDSVAGLELNAKFARVGAEYEDFQSNLSPYTAMRLVESVNVEPTEESTLSLDLGQSWTTYPDTHREHIIYHFILRSRVRVTSYFTLNAEGGFRLEEGEGFDQTFKTARLDMDFKYSKLTFKAGYEFQDEDYLGELRQRHFFYAQARRTF